MRKLLEKLEESIRIEESDMSVANEILSQLGGNKFIAMTGAKNMAGGKNSLLFSIGTGAKKGINKVKITLNGKDLYDIEFGKYRAGQYKTVDSKDDVYADSLRSVFTQVTGFDTHL